MTAFLPFLTKDIILLQSEARFVLICLKLLKTWHFALILTAQHLLQASCINRFFQTFHC